MRSLRPAELAEPRLPTRTRESDVEPVDVRAAEPERTALLDLDADCAALPALLAASRPTVRALLAPLEEDFDDELPERTIDLTAERAAERPTEAAADRPEEDLEAVAREPVSREVERVALLDLLA